jgi:anti-sigma factor RsiW
MTEVPYLGLIHAAIDGELEPRQRAELASCLLADPQARATHDSLARMCAALDAMPAIEPPRQLRASILAALPPVAAGSRPARGVARGSVAAWRYAAVFAGALITAGVVYEAGVGRGPDATEVAGTMAAASAPLIVDTVRLDLGQVTGQAQLYRAAAGLRVELELAAPEPVDVLVTSGGETRRISGLGGPESARGQRTAIALPAGGPVGQTVDLTLWMAGHRIGAAQLKDSAGR